MSQLANNSPTSNINLSLETNKGDSYNNGVGSILEDFTKTSFSSIGFAVEKHNVWQSGCDVTASLGVLTVNGQCWNWCGGYPHPDRWRSTISQLKGQINILFSFGVKPTCQQYTEAQSKNIHIIHYPKQLDVFDDEKPSMINWLRSRIIEVLILEGVITELYNSVVNSIQVSFIDFRAVLYSKFSVCASWFKGFIWKIKGKHAKFRGTSQGSLDKTQDSLDYKNDSLNREVIL